MITNKNETICPYCIENIPSNSLICPICDEDISKVTFNCETCISCAKEIPKLSKFCPFCGSQISKFGLTIDQVKNILVEHLQKIKENSINNNVKQKIFTVGCIILLSISLLLTIPFIGFLIEKPLDVEAAKVTGAILFFFICFTLVYFLADKRAREMQTIKDPILFFKTYFKSLKDHRRYFAYEAVSPMGKITKKTRLLPFTIADIDSKQYDITTLKGFKKYWRSTLIGSGKYNRNIKIKSIKIAQEVENITILEITFKVQSYDITISIGKKKEIVTILKTLIKHNEKWYIAEGEFQGNLDFVKFNEKD